MADAKLTFTGTIHNPDGTTRSVHVVGREAWALLNLVEAGATGCTPITTPGPRWSHYVWLLRRDGFHVETLNEAHGGAFSGTHARYLLHGTVTLDGGNLAEWRPNGVRYPEARAAA